MVLVAVLAVVLGFFFVPFPSLNANFPKSNSGSASTILGLDQESAGAVVA